MTCCALRFESLVLVLVLKHGLTSESAVEAASLLPLCRASGKARAPSNSGKSGSPSRLVWSSCSKLCWPACSCCREAQVGVDTKLLSPGGQALPPAAPNTFLL